MGMNTMPTELDMGLPSVLPVISASRRTDLARCFPAELSGWLQAGAVRVTNPFNGKERQVDLRPEAVHTLVLWSKDYSRLLADEQGLRQQIQRYAQVYFHLTITGFGGGPYEPGIRGAEKVGSQFQDLVRLAGDARRVSWRFDPILFWHEGERIVSNLIYFQKIAAAAAQAGVTRMRVSLCHWYAKARRRADKAGLPVVVPEPARIAGTAAWLQAQAAALGLEVQACCCPELVQAGIPAGHCIDGGLLAQLHPEGRPAALGKDTGQRQDCGCTPSVDIGDYRLSCPQGCVYCYANPQ